ncbi:hypothetical protein [Tenacibaculum aestuariivivum]|uniref:hypothetical protein n=1 Tax=Tenacibaculum aestuariivivum TaxID=2006131 RepID=UPI003AB6184A
MKNLLLLFSIGLLLIFCTSEENEITENKKASLIKLEQRQIENGVLTEKIIFEYKNNKPTLASFYDNNNQLTATSEWIYSNNALSSIKGYSSNGTLNSEKNITYDNSNRIIKTERTEENGTYLTTTNFTYNNDNTITSVTNSNGNTSTKIFEINSTGIINREIVNGNIRVSIDYDNLTPISSTSYSTTYNYTYKDNGSLPFSFDSVFGTNRINVVLFQNYLDNSIGSLITKLITKITSNSSTEEYVYTLNEDNFPLTKKGFYDGKLVNEFDYTYE